MAHSNRVIRGEFNKTTIYKGLGGVTGGRERMARVSRWCYSLWGVLFVLGLRWGVGLGSSARRNQAELLEALCPFLMDVIQQGHWKTAAQESEPPSRTLKKEKQNL